MKRLFDKETIYQLFQIASLIVTIATAITALTPSKTDDKLMQHVQNVLNILAGNVLHNTNHDSPWLEIIKECETGCMANTQMSPVAPTLVSSTQCNNK